MLVTAIIGAAALAAVPNVLSNVIGPAETAQVAVQPAAVGPPSPARPRAPAGVAVPESFSAITSTDESRNPRGQVTQTIVHFADSTREVTETDYNANGQPDRITITHRDGRQTIRELTNAPRPVRR
jgi:hypothetical protein